jgi:microcystin-dependent protein
MAVSLTHTFVSAKGNGTDNTLVQPSNWNDQHVLTCGSGVVLGRTAVGTGAVGELPITASGAAILAAADSNAAALAVGAIPIGGGIDWWDDTLPAGTNGVVWGWGNGQAISRTTYSVLFARWGTRYGVGDGSTTFNVPDVREYVRVHKSTMGGTASAGRIPQYGLTVVGTVIGEASHTLVASELPVITPTFSGTTQTWNVSLQTITGAYNQGLTGGGSTFGTGVATPTVTVTPAGTISSFGANGAHNNTQLGIVCNYIFRLS